MWLKWGTAGVARGRAANNVAEFVAHHFLAAQIELSSY